MWTLSKIDKGLEDVLGLPVRIVEASNSNFVKAEIEEEIVAPINYDERDLEQDYQIARNNFHELLEQGKDALVNILTLAKQGDEARPYEVTGQILKHLSDMNKDLLDIHKRKREVKATARTQDDVQQQNVTNAVFVGSTQELLEIMRNKKK